MQLRTATLVGILTSMVTGVTLGVMLARNNRVESPIGDDARTFAEVLQHVSNEYVDEVSREQLLDDALRGMVSGLDAHSKYLDQHNYDELQIDATGQFGGIGVELGLLEGYFTIISPMPGTPAESAGIRAGDRLIAVDGEPLRGKRLLKVISMLRGTPGSETTLTLLRRTDATGPERLQMTLKRASIGVPSVTHRVLAPGYVYFRISRFHRETHADLKQAITATGTDLDGIVLDLRNNPGGILGASVDVAGEFLEGGPVVSTKGREQTALQQFDASPAAAFPDTPLIVLIDGGSASAAEIVAGALRDRNRATLMGTNTYGKGSVQSVLNLPGRRGIKLTTAHYYTPTGAAIHESGIAPDITWEGDPDKLIDAALTQLKTKASVAIAPHPA